MRADKIRRYVEQADKALEAKNLLGAANALRLALSLSPDDEALAEHFGRRERDAAAAFVNGTSKNRRAYDEHRGHIAEAAKSYEKALKGRPSATVYERTAHCLIEARAELKKAFDLPERPLSCAPKRLLIESRWLASMRGPGWTKARSESSNEHATLDPGDDTIKDWIKRVKRGEI